MKVASLFCGCGGLDFGFDRTPGYEMLLALDSQAHAVGVYNANLTPVAQVRDVRALTEADKLLLGQADVILGGPPCTDFSTLGKMVMGANADLSRVFCDIVCEAMPAYFVMENVPAMLSVGAAVWAEVEGRFRDAGYGLSTQVLHAVDYGVPQRRCRLIVVGTLCCDDGEVTPLLEALKVPHVSVRQQLEADGLPPTHEAFWYNQRNQLRRAVFSMDDTHPTLCTRPIGNIPPNYTFLKNDATNDRTKVQRLTAAQIASVHTYPTDWVWPPSFSRTVTLIGNSVPPRLSSALAQAVLLHSQAALARATP